MGKRGCQPKQRYTPRRIFCKRCSRTRLAKFFAANASRPTLKQFYCKDCDELNHKTVPSRTDPVLRRAHKFKVRYGITIQQYDELVFKQDGQCAICSDQIGRLLHVDHDHKTNKIRGLLCGHCNKAIGLLRDDPENARRAALYLLEEE